MIPTQFNKTTPWRDKLLATSAWLAAAIVSLFFIWLLSDILWHGIQRLSWDFLTSDPLDAGRSGGIGPIIVSTLLILTICLVVAIPIGLGCAIYLAEYAQQAHPASLRYIRGSLDVLASMPSIVLGLFGSAFFCILLGFGFSILSGGLTLACMVLPLLIRTAEQGLRDVAHEHRTSAAALGLSRYSTLLHIIIPAAAPAIMVGIVLSVGRALAETAALIYTAGYVTRMPESIFDSGRTLSIHIYDLSMNVPGGNSTSYGSALVLIILLLFINISTAWLNEKYFTRKFKHA